MAAIAEVAGDDIEIKYICPFIDYGTLCRNPKCPCIHGDVLREYSIQPNADGVYTLDGRHYKRGVRLLTEGNKTFIKVTGMEYFSCSFRLRIALENLSLSISEIIDRNDYSMANKLLFIMRRKYQEWRRIKRKCCEIFNTIDNKYLVWQQLPKWPKLKVQDYRDIRDAMEKKYETSTEILSMVVSFTEKDDMDIKSIVKSLILINSFESEFRIITKMTRNYVNRLEKFLKYKYDFEFTPDELAKIEIECELI